VGALRLKIAKLKKLQSNRDGEVEEVDEARGSSEIALGPGHRGRWREWERYLCAIAIAADLFSGPHLMVRDWWVGL
jgi:hypothetical protein